MTSIDFRSAQPASVAADRRPGLGAVLIALGASLARALQRANESVNIVRCSEHLAKDMGAFTPEREAQRIFEPFQSAFTKRYDSARGPLA